jgi:hypothetical protein
MKTKEVKGPRPQKKEALPPEGGSASLMRHPGHKKMKGCQIFKAL